MKHILIQYQYNGSFPDRTSFAIIEERDLQGTHNTFDFQRYDYRKFNFTTQKDIMRDALTILRVFDNTFPSQKKVVDFLQEILSTDYIMRQRNF